MRSLNNSARTQVPHCNVGISMDCLWRSALYGHFCPRSSAFLFSLQELFLSFFSIFLFSLHSLFLHLLFTSFLKSIFFSLFSAFFYAMRKQSRRNATSAKASRRFLKLRPRGKNSRTRVASVTYAKR